MRSLLLLLLFLSFIHSPAQEKRAALNKKHLETESSECVLPDGRYKVVYDKGFEGYSPFEFEIKKDSITFFDESDSGRKKIEKNSNCILSLVKEEINVSEMTPFQKMLDEQHLFYDFKRINDFEYSFIWRWDLHLMTISGRFIRIK